MTKDCARAEILAGAVALGEATDAERDAYRRHLGTCHSCIDAFGGEREIERLMTTVAQARDAERWEPDIRGALASPHRRGFRFWKLGFATAGIALALSLGIHAFVASQVSGPVELAAVQSVAPAPFHVSLERRAPGDTNRPAPKAAAAQAHGIVVVHNVVTLTRPAAAAPQTTVVAAAPARPAAAPVRQQAVAPKSQVADNVVAASGPSYHDERTIAALQTAATSGPPVSRAESLAVMPNQVHEVAPIGGESAIVPRPAALAYDERAEGTTVFEVAVDERGTPTKCTITKSSSYMVLDVAVCKAAMAVRYSPRTINGHPAQSIYHDAFTFRNDDE